MYITNEELLQLIQSTSQYYKQPPIGSYTSLALCLDSTVSAYVKPISTLLHFDCRIKNVSLSGIEYVCAKLPLLAHDLSTLLDDSPSVLDIINVGFLNHTVSDIMLNYKIFVDGFYYPRYFRAYSDKYNALFN